MTDKNCSEFLQIIQVFGTRATIAEVNVQTRVMVAWGGAYGINGYILRCGNDITHAGITRHDVKYEEKRREYFSMGSSPVLAPT